MIFNRKLTTLSNVLHICAGYAYKKLYSDLFASIYDLGLVQTVYAPRKSYLDAVITKSPRSEIKLYSRNILRPLHRIFFRTKINTITKDLLKLLNIQSFGLVHAHFLYSDGAVALKLYQNKGVPFIVNIRNTDINFFIRLRPDLRWLMHSIVSAAHALIFLSPAYKDHFINILPRSIASKVSSRCHVIPNGLSAKWFDIQPISFNKKSETLIKVLYVGNFSRNKNLKSLIKAVENILIKRPISLTIVGGSNSGNSHTYFDALRNKTKFPWINFLGQINDRLKLQRIYREHTLFAMPSFRETFGLVYIEALSQGLPIVYSKGQGVDGYFLKNNVAVSVDPYSIDSIVNGILEAAELTTSNGINCVEAAQSFKWSNVAKKYLEIYETVLSKG